jgi:hypothetical protein
VPGPKGDTGSQGIQGIQGPKGDTGSTGPTGPGVAAGGTAGQYLRKTSGTDYATAFAGIATSEVTGLDTALTGKAGTASPTFTGTVTMPTQVAGTAALLIPSGTLLTNATAGALEQDGDGLYVTPNTTIGRRRIKEYAMVISQANSSAATTNTPVSCFAAANDVLSTLKAAWTYRFRAWYYFTSTFTSGTANIQTLFAFSNAPASFRYTYKTHPTTGGTALNRVGMATVTTATQVSANVTATITLGVEIEGFMNTHATNTSTFTPQFQMSTTGSSTVVIAGSYIEVEELESSSVTLIAGGWA